MCVCVYIYIYIGRFSCRHLLLNIKTLLSFLFVFSFWRMKSDNWRQFETVQSFCLCYPAMVTYGHLWSLSRTWVLVCLSVLFVFSGWFGWASLSHDISTFMGQIHPRRRTVVVLFFIYSGYSYPPKGYKSDSESKRATGVGTCLLGSCNLFTTPRGLYLSSWSIHNFKNIFHCTF